jgi:hypothetical protein
MDINIAIDHLGLNANSYKLTQSVPPHSIVEWNGPDPQPTEAELQAAYDAAVSVEALKTLRTERNALLSETDYLALADVTLTDEMRAYRQALRDLPANTTDPANPVWPTKPE